MRDIHYLVVHCTATAQSATVASIIRYWKEHLGWRSPGYHKIVPPSGAVITLAGDERICNGVKGHNTHSLHVSYIGGVDAKGKPKDTRTKEQKEAIRQVLEQWRKAYPDALIQGHRDFAGVAKACPSFDALLEYSGL